MTYSVRAASLSDEELLLEWANDHFVRRHSFQSDLIGVHEHQLWFRKRLESPERTKIYIFERDGVAVGQTRFEYAHPHWWLNYSVAGQHRGQGLAKIMLWRSIEKLMMELGKVSIKAAVKPENQISRKLCLELGILDLS